MGDEEIEKLFVDMDKDKSGKINYSEFLVAMKDSSKLRTEKFLKEAFDHFDTDKNGQITKDEVRKAAQAGWISEDQLMNIFKENDANKDDKVVMLSNTM